MRLIYIIVGAVAGLSIIIAVAYCCCKGRNNEKNKIAVQQFDTSKNMTQNNMMRGTGPDVHPTLNDDDKPEIQMVDFEKNSKPSSKGEM